MRNKQKAFIFDLDGTLLDSYKVIVSSLYQTCIKYQINISEKEINEFIIKNSVKDFINLKSKEYNFNEVEFKNDYSLLSLTLNEQIELISHTKELLQSLKENNHKLYVFTHRGISTFDTLKRLDIDFYFDEIVNSQNGFKRKPEPDGINYLVEKYHLDVNETYYVGDRTIDIDCAVNANIKSILYVPKGSYTISNHKETYQVSDLLDILKIAN